MKEKRTNTPILVVGSGEFIHPAILQALFESEDIRHENDDDITPQELQYIPQFRINQIAFA